VSLSVYDARGRLVRTLLAGERTLREEVAWDGRDDDNRTVASGVLLCRAADGQRRSAVKLALLK
jgi:flagellar hook assembly protein FlgD